MRDCKTIYELLEAKQGDIEALLAIIKDKDEQITQYKQLLEHSHKQFDEVKAMADKLVVMVEHK